MDDDREDSLSVEDFCVFVGVDSADFFEISLLIFFDGFVVSDDFLVLLGTIFISLRLAFSWKFWLSSLSISELSE